MNKYSEIETKTAKNLLKEGYKWIARNGSGKLFAYYKKPIKADTGCYSIWYPIENSGYVCKELVPIFQSIRFDDKEPTSLESIVHPQILDDAEKRYLSAVIKPFRNRVQYIEKMFEDHLLGDQDCYLFIRFNDGNYDMNFPVFRESIMYKGMERYKKYTLEELGL